MCSHICQDACLVFAHTWINLLYTIGYGIINADGELWKAQRKAGLAFLSTANLRILTDVALPQYLSHAVERLTSLSDGNVVDLQKIFHEITTQLMGKMAYNVRQSYSPQDQF